MENPKARSLFELEAERIAALNKNKHPKANKSTFMDMLIGGGIGLVIALVFCGVVFIPLTIYTVFVHGFVAAKIWQWYVVPAFGVAPITWIVGGALMLLVRLFTYTIQTDKKSELTTKEKIMNFVATLLVPWYTLLIAWAFHFFVK